MHLKISTKNDCGDNIYFNHRGLKLLEFNNKNISKTRVFLSSNDIIYLCKLNLNDNEDLHLKQTCTNYKKCMVRFICTGDVFYYFCRDTCKCFPTCFMSKNVAQRFFPDQIMIENELLSLQVLAKSRIFQSIPENLYMDLKLKPTNETIRVVTNKNK